jgi:hypothetical protein
VSTEERERAIGKAATEFAASTSELAALKHKAHEVGSALSKIGQYFQDFGGNDRADMNVRGLINQLPPKDELGHLLEEISEKKSRRQHLRQILTDAGVEPKL